MTLIKVDMTRYFELVKEEKEYLGQSGYSRKYSYLEDFAKDQKEKYQELLNYDTILRSEIYFRQKQDYINLIEDYLEKKLEFKEFWFRIQTLQKRDEKEKQWFDDYFQEKELPTLITDSRAKEFYQLLSELFSRVFPTALPDSDSGSGSSKKPKVTEEQFRKVVQIQEIFSKIQDLLISEKVKLTKIDLSEYIQLYDKFYYKKNNNQIISDEEKENYQNLRVHVWSEYYFRQKQDYLDLIENYLENRLDLLNLKFLFLKIDQRDNYGKEIFEQDINLMGFSTLMTDSRAFRFYELLSELYESMIFDKVDGEQFPRSFHPVHRDSFFTKKSRDITEKEFKEEIQKTFLKMQYLLNKK